LRLRAPDAAGAAILLLLSGCAGTGAIKKNFPQDSHAVEPETGGGCRPLMDPLIDALDTSRWGAGRDDLELRSNRDHSCWNRVWEVPTAIVAYPTATVFLVGVVTSPVWVPLLLFVVF
jgi:hypothetical protein